MRYFLRTKRLGFRCWTEADLPLAMRLWGDADVMSLLGGPLTKEAVKERLEREQETQRTAGAQYWPIFLRETGEPAGCAGLTPWPAGGPGCSMAGVHLHRATWGQRLGEEAGEAILQYGFARLGMTEVVAGHHPANHASRRLLKALGFVYEREHLWPPTGLLHPFYRLRRDGARPELLQIANDLAPEEKL